jgi:arsenite methyltransferase
VTNGPLPEAIKKSLSAWAGCIAGALEINEYKSAMEAAGFTDISITPSYFDEAIIDEAVRDMGDQINLKVISREAISKSVFSARITAHKP